MIRSTTFLAGVAFGFLLTRAGATRYDLVAGALLFGVGWGLSGSSPGTALAQPGEGRGAAPAAPGTCSSGCS